MSPTWLVDLERRQGATVLVDGPATASEARTEAMARHGAGEVFPWACVDEPVVVDTQPYNASDDMAGGVA